MTSDILLTDNNEVHVNGWRLVLNGPDLVIDCKDRRVNNTEFRRAIVHGPNDTLIINFEKDYPNGVIVQSGMTVDGDIKAETVEADIKARTVEVAGTAVADTVRVKTVAASDKITVGEKSAIQATNLGLQLGEDGGQAIDVHGKGLQVRGGIQVMDQAYFNHPIRTPDITITQPPAPGISKPTYNLLDRIEQLERRIQALENT